MVNVDVATPKNEHQQSVNDFGYCVLYNPRAMLLLLPIIEVVATFMGNMVNVDVTTPKNERQQSVNRASMIICNVSKVIGKRYACCYA